MFDAFNYAGCEDWLSLRMRRISFLFQYVAGFGEGGTSLSFWEDVDGFNTKCVGDEVVCDATQNPIIAVVDSKRVPD